jgi:hypothetical protein
MPFIITIDKAGKMKETQIKEYNEQELYKKTSYKTGEGFESRHVWNISIHKNEYEIALFAKIDGRAGQENKYEFPPPVAEILFFGTCILVNQNGKKDLKIDEWKEICDKLMGGFDDLDEDDISEDDEYSNLQIGCDGYARDGFVIEDEEEEDDEEEEEEDEDEEIVSKKKRSISKEKTVSIKKKGGLKKSVRKMTTIVEDLVEPFQESENYLDCQSELSEEEYLS